MNNHNDVLLEQLADKGDGVCSYVDSPEEARKAIVDRFTGAFETIARDVKIQVEFDPAQVQAYRLLGYENRAIADQSFRDDRIDAGEVGAGHQVTALYEIERTQAPSEKPLAIVRLRWKAPRNVNAPSANEEANEVARPVLASQQTGFEGAGVGYRRAAVVAQFAEFLRRSVHARGDSLDDLIAEADKLVKETGDAETAEFVLLVHKSKQLILNALPACDDLCQAIDAVRRNSLLRCQEELLAKESNQKILEDIEAENRKLEERIRDLLRRRLEEKTK
jgi:Ca-activated chloride channel family protein